MNTLIKEVSILLLPSLVLEVGLNAAILLQQLHVNLLFSTNVQDGHQRLTKQLNNGKPKNSHFGQWTLRKKWIYHFNRHL